MYNENIRHENIVSKDDYFLLKTHIYYKNTKRCIQYVLHLLVQEVEGDSLFVESNLLKETFKGNTYHTYYHITLISYTLRTSRSN